MSEFRRPSPVESGEPTEPTLARDESKQAKLTRRGFLKGALGLGLAAAISPLPDFSQKSVSAESLDASGEESEDETQLVILENFQEYTPEAMSEAVETNINTFKKTNRKNILGIGEQVKAKAKISGFGDVLAPLVDPSPGTQDNGLTYFISSKEDSQKGFPNLAVATGNTVFEGDRKATILYLQGIYLGRTVHPFESASGEFTADVGYFGMYMGDPDVKVTRIVMPVLLGISNNNGQMESFLYTSISGVDEEPISAPFSTSGLSPSLTEGKKLLDSNVANGVTVLQIDSLEIPPPDLPDQAEALGLPREPYTIEYINEEINTTLNTRESLQNITIKLAEDAEYMLNSIVGNESPVPTPIPTAYPSISDIDVKAEQKRYPNYKKYISAGSLSAEDTVALPRVMTMHISPTSKKIA